MAWYKFTCSHGRQVQYHWFDEDLDKQDKIFYLEEFFGDIEYGILRAIKINKLPKHITKEKIVEYKERIKYARRMLKMLAKLI